MQYGSQNWTTSIQGVSAELSADHQLADRQRPGHHAATTMPGRRWSSLIGQTVSRQLFGADENPIGAIIQVKGAPLRVIGMLASQGPDAVRARTRTISS